jgi:uncharacterized OB-fold protein
MTTVDDLANGDSKEFWQGARDGRLLFQRCCACGEVQFPPRHQCATCWATIVRRAPTPAFRTKVPYAVAVIAVQEGPRMITNLVGEGALDAKIGDTVIVEFTADSTGHILPQFRCT